MFSHCTCCSLEVVGIANKSRLWQTSPSRRYRFCRLFQQKMFRGIYIRKTNVSKVLTYLTRELSLNWLCWHNIFARLKCSQNKFQISFHSRRLFRYDSLAAKFCTIIETIHVTIELLNSLNFGYIRLQRVDAYQIPPFSYGVNSIEMIFSLNWVVEYVCMFLFPLPEINGDNHCSIDTLKRISPLFPLNLDISQDLHVLWYHIHRCYENSTSKIIGKRLRIENQNRCRCTTATFMLSPNFTITVIIWNTTLTHSTCCA